MVRKPPGIDERPLQLRPPVLKAKGGTDSERYLARLADKSFLNLWSYPSPYRDQKLNQTGDGKELCDLLVVCGEHVIIFSEKKIEWLGGDVETAWSRWSKRAIRDSAKQTKGAERWLNDFPERVFLDKACTVPFPIDLPPIEHRRVHRVVVANGSSQACKNYTSGKCASLRIVPSIVGNRYWMLSGDSKPVPFAIGDIDPEGSFVHVFNEAALDIIMTELDTIRDFTDYLEKKAEFVRSGKLHKADGEENLLAYYAARVNSRGDHDFIVEAGETPIAIDHRQYSEFVGNPRYIAKKQADKISYFWDQLVLTFTNSMLDGTSITLEGYDFDLRKNEIGVRQMALVPRFVRRSYSEAIAGAFEKGKKSDTYFRAMMGREGAKESETAFFILTVKYHDWIEAKGSYEKYREMRAGLAQIYAQGLLERHAYLKRVVGISREPPGQGSGVSEDMVYAEQQDWSDEERGAIRKNCENAEILQNTRELRYQGDEFPQIDSITVDTVDVPFSGSRLNRKQRRMLKARSRRSKH